MEIIEEEEKKETMTKMAFAPVSRIHASDESAIRNLQQ
jgi:hypothetical protein